MRNFTCMFCQKEIGENIICGTLGNYNFECKDDKATFYFDDFDVMFCYSFLYLHYELEFWPDGLYSSTTPIFRIEDIEKRHKENRIIIELNYLPDINPSNVEKWMSKLLKLKVFL